MNRIKSWWLERRLIRVARELCEVNAAIAQERVYLPTIYPNVIGPLVVKRAGLQYDLGDVCAQLGVPPPKGLL